VIAIRRLGPGDETVLAALARDDAAFDEQGRGRPRESISPSAAAEYLANEQVLHWVAESAGAVVGHVLCYVQRRRADEPVQLMLYEIGVRDNRRREGIGRALVAEMDAWMSKNGVSKVWVLSTAEAEPFYAACGFSRDDPAPIQMSRRL
jgi:N-acetylglutamate synthase-like GNAT family acetyltransferase